MGLGLTRAIEIAFIDLDPKRRVESSLQRLLVEGEKGMAEVVTYIWLDPVLLQNSAHRSAVALSFSQ